MIQYRFEELQQLKFAVYDVDNESPSLEDDDFLGQVVATLGNIVSEGSVTLKLQKKNESGEGKGDLGTITVRSMTFYTTSYFVLCTPTICATSVPAQNSFTGHYSFSLTTIV